MAVYTVQSNFSKGEISPLAYGRVDVDFFRQSLERLRNFTCLVHGGFRRRSGTVFVAEVVDSASESRLFPFTFNNEQSYVLDINGSKDMQFLAQRGYLGAPYQVAHPWDDTDIWQLTYTQFNDVAYFAHEEWHPRKLSRLADTNWTLGLHDMVDGPYLSENLTDTTLRPAERGTAVPIMTSNTAPSPYVVTSTSSASDAYDVFDGSSDTQVVLASTDAGFVKIDLGSGNAKAVDNYWIQGDVGTDPDTPTSWTLEGSNDDTNWEIIDRIEGETGWNPAEIRYFETKNTDTYRYYRLRFAGGGGSDSSNSALTQLVLHHEASDQTPFNLTASSTTGINGGDGFQPSDAGRNIRILGTDGLWRWCEITSVTSTTVVKVRMYGQALPDLTPVKEWRLGAFSTESGWPSLIELFDERLVFGRTDTQPVTVWMSQQGAFDNFGESDPLLSTDGISLTYLVSNMNELVWLHADEELVSGSAKQIRSLGPADTTVAFSATNFTQRKGPTSGAAKVQPVTIGDTIIYAAAGAKKLRELITNERGRLVAPELSLIGEHTLDSGIVWMCFSENPEPTLFVGTEDGNVAAILYDREQRAIGFAVCEFPNGIAESGAVVPAQTAGYDDLYLVMRRTINGATKRYIEVMEHPFHYSSDVVEVDGRPTATDGFFVDCGLTYSGSAATTISNLDHLEGEEVVALADGAVVTGLTVSGGQVTLPYAASTVHIGLAYESYARTHRYSGPGQDGYLFGRSVQSMAAYVDLLSTGSLEVGAYGDGDWTPETYEVNPHASDAFTGNPVELISGVHRCDIEGSWMEGAGRIVMKTSAPLPCLVRMLQIQAEYEP